MSRTYATSFKKSNVDFSPDPLAAEIIAEQEAAHRRDQRKLDDLAFTFLNATDGDRVAAENLLDDSLDLLCEGGALQLYRYRIVLAGIRAGL